MFLRMHHTADFLETETETLDRNISSKVLLEKERDKLNYFDHHLNVAYFLLIKIRA